MRHGSDASKQLEHLIDRPVGETVADAYRDNPIDSVILRGAGLEERAEAEVVAGRIDRLAAVQLLRCGRFAGASALVGHHDKSVICRLQEVELSLPVDHLIGWRHRYDIMGPEQRLKLTPVRKDGSIDPAMIAFIVSNHLRPLRA